MGFAEPCESHAFTQFSVVFVAFVVKPLLSDRGKRMENREPRMEN